MKKNAKKTHFFNDLLDAFNPSQNAIIKPPNAMHNSS
jgi:hypothetical protein